MKVNSIKVGSIDIETVDGLLDKQDVIKEMNLQNGKVFNVAKLRKDMAIIETKVADQKGTLLLKLFQM